MSDDRSRSSRPGSGRSSGSGSRGSSGGKRGGTGRPSGKPGSKPAGRSGKPAGRSSGPSKGRPGGKPGSKSGGRSGGSGRPPRDGRRDDRRDDRRDGRGDDRRGGRRDDRRDDWRAEPRTEAERRAAAVRATRGPRRTERTPELEQEQIESRTTEQWIDEGSVRSEAAAATRRASGGGSGSREPAEIDPEVVAEIQAALSPDRAKRLTERLGSASAALDRERFEEALRIVTPLTRELPHVAAVHEVSGLAAYRLGRWKKASQSLELARQLHDDPALLPVLADCYRAQRRWIDVDAVWDEIKSKSPPHDIMAEGRIVVANSLAEQGKLKDAISMMNSVSQKPKRVRDHHLRQWYVLADLYDRAGDTMAASRWFTEVARNDPQFADVSERLRALGR